MMKNKFKFFLSAFFVFTNTVLGRSLPQNHDEFCQRVEDSEQILSFLNDEENLLSFENQGGILNGGVCWWHSRFQRNLIYLTMYRPDLPLLKPSEVHSLLAEIRLGKSIIMIPGFSNVQEFSRKYKKEIIKILESWQMYDGVVLMKWTQGLAGKTSIAPLKLKNMMDKLYKYVSEDKKIAYAKLQIKGIAAHAWLINGISKHADGYVFSYLDSNWPKSTFNYHYNYGDKSFTKKEYGNFLPYLEFVKEEERLSQVIRANCDPSYKLPADHEALWSKNNVEDLNSVKESIFFE